MEVLKHFVEDCIGSIQFVAIEIFWSLRTFSVKKSYMKIQKSFRIILILYAKFLTKDVLVLQNVPKPHHPPTPHPRPVVYY